MGVPDSRREAREADERRGFGCARCAWSAWFDEAVDFGWWCDERDEFIGEPIRCGEFLLKDEVPSDVPGGRGARGSLSMDQHHHQ